MLEKLNGVSSFNRVNDVYKPTFKGTLNNTVTSPIECPNGNCGINALGAYNLGILEAGKNLKVEIIEPIKVTPETVKGENIYSSNGRLHSIIDNDGTTSTIYKTDNENPDKIKTITKIDLNTGNKIFQQDSELEDGLENIYIYEYDKNTGKPIKHSMYRDGKFVYANNTVYKPNGNNLMISSDSDGGCFVSESNPKTNAEDCIDFDKNKQIKYMHKRRIINNVSISDNIEFYNGIPISINRSKDTTIPNTAARDLFNTPEMKPAERFTLDIDYKTQEGDKTYYSNGAIESNTINSKDGKITAYFNPDGSYFKIVTDNKEFEFIDNKTQKITENLGDNIKKETSYYDNGECHVSYNTRNMIKEASYYDNGNPNFYVERPVNNNDDSIEYKSLFFNKQGMLESC